MPVLPNVARLVTIALVCTIAVERGLALSLGYGRAELMGASFALQVLYPIRLRSTSKPTRKGNKGKVCGGDSLIYSCATYNTESCTVASRPHPSMTQKKNYYNWKKYSSEGIKLHALCDLRKWVKRRREGGFNAFHVPLRNPYHLILISSSRRRRFGGKQRQLLNTTHATGNAPSFNGLRSWRGAIGFSAAVGGVAAILGFPHLSRASMITLPIAGLKIPIGSGNQVVDTRVGMRLLLWLGLFLSSAMLHSAEIAITTLYPWKVKEFAEEEGERSPFQTLNKDVTRILTTILFATTMCSIYSAALFTNLAVQAFGPGGLACSTGALTIITLFFGELLPKALGVSNPEMVTRALMPIINVLAVVVSPVGLGFSKASKLVLGLFGFRSEEGGSISEEALRLIVMGASKSGGIEKGEANMVEAVLDLSDTKVSKVMCPRTEVVAIDQHSTLRDLYALVLKDKYSRIPVYDGTIDNITGVALSKVLLEYLSSDSRTTALDETTVADVMEPPFFVPETGSVGRVLEEMKARHLHQATVVDEYGGTSGIVTMEDIIEEVVGEIYDEEDDEAFKEEGSQIALNDDGTYAIQGMAHIEDVFLSLDMPKATPDDLREFGTLSGYLCSQADKIPEIGDEIPVGGYVFTVTQADERRIIEVKAELVEGEEKEDGSTGTTQNGKIDGGTDSVAIALPS